MDPIKFILKSDALGLNIWDSSYIQRTKRLVTQSPRYAYIKNGDSVTQINRITKAAAISTSGPDAFLADFVHKIPFSRMLLISRQRHEAHWENDVIEAFSVDGGAGRLAKLWKRPWVSFRLMLNLLKFDPDRILCGSTGSLLWVSFLISRWRGVPMLHSRHNRMDSHDVSTAHGLSNRIDRWCLRRIEGTVCHGPYLVKEVCNAGVSPDHVVEFDVCMHDLLAAREEANDAGTRVFPPNERHMLFVGRLENEKGIFELLRESVDLLRNFSDLHLTFIGGGTRLTALQNEVSKLALDKQVHIIGELSHKELVPWLDQALVVITPTRPEFPEGRCMVVMEALVMGTPAIVPGFGPFTYLIEDGVNGHIFKAGDTDDLHRCLTAFLSDPQRQNDLIEGARRTGESLIEPNYTFAEAVLMAFERAHQKS